MEKETFLHKLEEYALMTISTVILTAGVYCFKFPNNFSFGGVTGLAVVLSRLLPFSASIITNGINIGLLVLGFVFLGRGFGTKTVYVTILMSVLLAVLDKVWPLTEPLTDQPILELFYAILLPAVASAILFNIGASSGGTDIVAMIIRKYAHYNIGTALLAVDIGTAVLACFVFGIQTGLFSILGLIGKSFLIDDVIESINLCKYFTVICDEPQPICDFIMNTLHRGATICKAEGAYSHKDKYVVYTVVHRNQAALLKNYVRKQEPHAFLLVSNTSEITGKGFHVAP